MRVIGAGLLLCLATVGCNSADASNWGGTITDSAGVAIVSNPAEADWTLVPRPTIEQDLDIGAIEGDETAYQFGVVASIDVNERGDVFVLDQQASEVRVFDAQGKHLRTFGKRGGGPGEFSQMAMFLRVGAGDTVFVADLMGQRLARIAPDGVETGSYPFAFTSGIPFRFQPAPGGKFAVQLRKLALPGMIDTVAAPDRVILRDVTGAEADTILELASGRTIEFGPTGPKIRMFEAEPVWTLLNDGRIVRGRSDSYRFEVLSPTGQLERIISRPMTAKPVTEADRHAILQLLEKAYREQPQITPQVLKMILDNTSFAAEYPVLGALSAGPGNTLWVQRVRTVADVTLAEGETFQPEDINSPDWDVFDQQGRLLGTVTLPEGFIPLRVTEDAVYGRIADELDVQHVIRVRVK